MTITPSADFCRPVRIDHSTLSRDSTTDGRSPEVSSTAFRAQPPNLQPASLMDMGFVVICQLARRRMPLIRFLSIGSHVCSTLLSDLPLPERPCASLSLHLHQVVKRTFTFELSNMLGTQQKAPGLRRGPFLIQPGVTLPADLDTAWGYAATTGRAGTSAATVRDNLYPKGTFSLEIRGAGRAAQCLQAGLGLARGCGGVSR